MWILIRMKMLTVDLIIKFVPMLHHTHCAHSLSPLGFVLDLECLWYLLSNSHVRAQVSTLSASVARARACELSEWVSALACAVEQVRREASVAEGAQLPPRPHCMREYFAYQELNTQRCVRAFCNVPDFREMPIALQTRILKVLVQSYFTTSPLSPLCYDWWHVLLACVALC